MEKKGRAKQSYSFLQADQKFVKKILSRNSSVGNHSSSSPLESFRVPAEVPFKWESRPGEPKDKPETIEPPPRASPFPAATTTSESHAPPSAGMKRVGVKQFLKKVIERGQRSVIARKHSLRFTSSSVVAAARGFYSGEITTGLPRSSNHGSPSKSPFKKYNNNNNINDDDKFGFSTAPNSPCSSRASLTNDFNNLRFDKPSRMQKISKGCVKWMF